MLTNSSSRLLVELDTHSAQLISMDAAGLLTGYVECAADAASVTTALTQLGASTSLDRVQALVLPAALFAVRASAQEAASIRTIKSLLARAEAVAQTGSAAFKAVAFDSATGARVETVGSSPWVIAGAPNVQLAATKERLESLGLTAADMNLALPARIGAVAMTLQDLPDSTRVLVWQIGEADSVLACVSASGCEAVVTLPVGFTHLFDVVQASLGLRFRAAATKLFFNADYDFTDAAGPIAERLAALLRPAIVALGCSSTTLHVAGLPTAQAWLATALASALELQLFAPDLSAFCAQHKLTGAAVESGLPVAALGLLLRATTANPGDASWLPSWLDATAVVATPPQPVPAPAKVVAAVATPAKAVPVSVAAGAAPQAAAAAKGAGAAQAKPVVAARAASADQPIESTEVVAKPSATSPSPHKLSEDESPVDGKKNPLLLLVGVAGVLVLGGIGAFLAMRGGSSATSTPPDTAPVVAAVQPPATPVNTSSTAESVTAKGSESSVGAQVSLPSGFRNDHYSFTISDSGYLTSITNSGRQTVLNELGFLSVQGVSRNGGKSFKVSKITDVGYTPLVTKIVREGATVFSLTIKHEQFSLTSVITCLPTSLLIEAVLTPIQLEDARGPLSVVYRITTNRGSVVNGEVPVLGAGTCSYPTKAGVVSLKFDPTQAVTLGEPNKQAGEANVNTHMLFFPLGANANPPNMRLKAEILLP